MKSISRAKVLIKVVASVADGLISQAFWVHAAAGNAQAGQITWVVHFNSSKEKENPDGAIAHGADDEDLHLTIATEDPIKAIPLAFGGRVPPTIGRFVQITHWDLAAMILDVAAVDEPERTIRPLLVRFEKKVYEEYHARDYRILGNDDGVPPFQVTVTAADALSKSVKKPKGKSKTEVDWDDGVLPPSAGKIPTLALEDEHGKIVPGEEVLEEILHDCLEGEDEKLFKHLVGDSGSDSSSAGDVESDVEVDSIPPIPPKAPETGGKPGSSGGEHASLASKIHVEAFSLEELWKIFPDYHLNERWELRNKTTDSRIGQIRVCGAHTLKAHCGLPGHSKKCAGFPIGKHLEATQCVMVRWMLFGFLCTGDEHQEEGKTWVRSWKYKLASMSATSHATDA